MRPLLLSMTAFGPFPDQQCIHFDRMGETPLFLINGPTGAGKTTILDAICFALYGKTTGDEREGSQMRADLAAAELQTEVTLVFELAGSHYRIRRIPEQQKPKARGEGTTTRSPEAQLWRLDATGHGLGLAEQPDCEQLLVASKVTEATREIEQLTGLNADQFRQVMVLPQGKFRQLLMADSRDRERIFSQLFQTQIYRQLEERLKLKAAGVRRQVEQQRQLMLGILDGSGLGSEEALMTELAQLQPALQQSEQQKLRAEQQFRQASEALQQALQLDQAFRQLQATETELKQLSNASAAVDTQRLQLLAGEQARLLTPQAQQLQQQQHESAQLQQQLQQAGSEQQQAAAQLQQAQRRLDENAALEQQLDRSKLQLDALLRYSARADELRQAVQHRGQVAAAEQQALQQHRLQQQNLDRLLAEKQQTEQQHQAARQKLDALADKQVQLTQLAERRRQAQELQVLSQKRQRGIDELQQSERRGKLLADRHQQEQQAVKNLELRWHQGQAALLAAELVVDQPCPVCGSHQHPQPAHSNETIPDQQQLEQARSALQQLHQQLIDAREQYQLKKKDLEHLSRQIEVLQQQLGEERDPGQLNSRYDALNQQVQELLTLQQQSQQLSERIQQLRLGEADSRKQLQQAGTTHSEQQAQLAAATDRLQRAETELPEAWRHAGALETAIDKDRREITGLQERIAGIRQHFSEASDRLSRTEATLKSLTEQVTQQSSRIAASQAEWQQALEDSSFASEAEFQAACSSESQLQQLKQIIADFDKRYSELQGALVRQQQQLQGQQPPALTQLQGLLEQAEQQQRQADSQWQQLDRRNSQLRATETRLKQAQSEQQQREQEYRLVGTLSDVASGQTGSRISLQRFVLSVLLDDVLIEASQRLSLMSKGRYQLLRKEQRAKGNKASGLELEVEDAYTGKVRPVATLSGGESFMAALSMALGLSEVVQAYAGGIRLDTLFIDEGFGSLDPESLELAVRTLMDLQASGRMIGVISHVAELKEQMPLRLDVSADRGGSHIELVTPWLQPRTGSDG